MGKTIHIYLNDAAAKAFNELPKGERSQFVASALKLRAKPAEAKTARQYGLNRLQRNGLFRLTDKKNEPFWVKAPNDEPNQIPTSRVLTVCPNCKCNYYGGSIETESAHSSVRGFCRECRTEALLKSINTDASRD